MGSQLALVTASWLPILVDLPQPLGAQRLRLDKLCLTTLLGYYFSTNSPLLSTPFLARRPIFFRIVSNLCGPRLSKIASQDQQTPGEWLESHFVHGDWIRMGEKL